jgi:ornithine carbamoyltransferase
MLTAEHHPCQVLADLLTLREAFGALAGLRLAYVGDGNNVARSLALLGSRAGVEVVVASPEGTSSRRAPARRSSRSGRGGGGPTPCTPTCGSRWAMSKPRSERRPALAAYRVDDALLDLARPDAIALHDLPAHAGEEITAEVLYGPRQRIWDQAENRRHAQKALLEWLLQ